MIIGTRNGETRRSPFSRRTWTCSSRVCSPPTPVPKIVPNRAGSTPMPSVPPAEANASAAAAMANCSTRSARRASLGLSYHGEGSQSATSTKRPDVTPGPSRPVQNASTPAPQGASTPRPVTATRRPRPSTVRQLARDQVVGLADGLDALELLLGHLHTELLLERHHQLDEIEAVGVEVIAEAGLRRHLVLGDGQHLDGAGTETGEEFLVHDGLPCCEDCSVGWAMP